MSQADYFLTVGDRLPVIREILLAADGTAADLTAATSVVFVIQAADHAGAGPSSAPATIVDALAGEVEYDWLGADSATDGVYNARFVVTYNDGRQATFPNGDRPIEILVSART